MRTKKKQRRINSQLRALNKSVADLGWHFKQVDRKIISEADAAVGDPSYPVNSFYHFKKSYKYKINEDAIEVYVDTHKLSLAKCEMLNWGRGKYEDEYGKRVIPADEEVITNNHFYSYTKRPENYNFYKATLLIDTLCPGYKFQYNSSEDAFGYVWDDNKIDDHYVDLEWGHRYVLTDKKAYDRDNGAWDRNIWKRMYVTIKMWHDDGTEYELDVEVSSDGEMRSVSVYQNGNWVPCRGDKFCWVINDLIIEHRENK